MADTWAPMFDLSDKDKVSERNRKADGEIKELKGQLALDLLNFCSLSISPVCVHVQMPHIITCRK